MKQGRPKKPPTRLIQIPFDKLSIVEAILGYRVALNQRPKISVRVPESDVVRIRKALKCKNQ